MTHRSKRIAVTGLGAVAPNGVGVREFAQALRAGRSGVRLLEGVSADQIRSTVSAMCVEFDPGDVMSAADQRRLPKLVPMALAACREALQMAGLSAPSHEDSARAGNSGESIGLILGTGAGGIDFTLDQAEIAYGQRGRNQPSLWTITNATHGNLAGELSIHLGLRGPSLCVSTGCASSSDAIGMAMEMLRSDRPGAPEIMVVVGADAHVRWETLLGMELLRVISTRDFRDPANGDPATASRPFCRTRDGFVLGEGAWAMVLERESVVHQREALPLAHLLGYGCTCDAYHRVRPDPDMRQSARAMRQAMDDAHVQSDEIDVLHYHGTSTQLNDAAETKAVKLAFASHASKLRGHSVKSMIGHPQGACGAAAIVATIAGLTNQDGHTDGPFLFPTTNYREPDPQCDLNYTANRAVKTEARTFMVNCLAFGAKNSALVGRIAR